ncbi:putative imidazole glycerol phosphate synthase, cyclase subunit [Candidatus Zinderia insecticola CARI]|uniref:Imidazole glycerol phosphate synthase subunit HisF n=1 Tax=Zinderia insecticola (strain CARI) TaxID=871271 RepID=E0TJ08_ZINIC|nr:putative imidazole glycerol phosphate synthase, cyclase subunit [Candidatus Zinderia insecticola CARI]
MLTKRIIPCLDIKKGRVVKGTNFLNLKDAGDPILIAEKYYKEGADEITFLDINASYKGKKIILDIIRKISSKIFIPLTVGGGIKNIFDVKNILNSGADKVCINTSAILNPFLIREIKNIYGSQCLVVAIDVKKDKNKNWRIFTHGGRNLTNLNIIEWVKKVSFLGAGEILITSMDKDGTCNGFDIKLIKKISNSINIPVIASGGAGNLNSFFEVLKYGKADAVLAASVFHYNKLNIKKVKEFLYKNKIFIRL